MQGYITAFGLATLKVEVILDGELLDRFVAIIKPKIHERILLSSAKSFEEACISVEHLGIVYIDYGGVTHHSSNDGIYAACSKVYAPIGGINQTMYAKPCN